MPIYSFKNVKTEEIITLTMSWKEKQEFLNENQDYKSYFDSVPAVISGRGFSIKVDNGFKETLSKVKEQLTINNIKSY